MNEASLHEKKSILNKAWGRASGSNWWKLARTRTTHNEHDQQFPGVKREYFKNYFTGQKKSWLQRIIFSNVLHPKNYLAR